TTITDFFISFQAHNYYNIICNVVIIFPLALLLVAFLHNVQDDKIHLIGCSVDILFRNVEFRDASAPRFDAAVVSNAQIWFNLGELASCSAQPEFSQMIGVHVSKMIIRIHRWKISLHQLHLQIALSVLVARQGSRHRDALKLSDGRLAQYGVNYNEK
ncbi:hypothetical protein PFISCL1PPCAC_9023, partial [Pristionchus fissidentatus]